ncbi:CTP-dependent riboflavin kinase [Halobacterium sp. KA-4]|uniref:CTP-dependent riboflavin kinase n=1 Tax=Halobacterium sp. KA-4 TaxID=2896367 RepID=UPI001E329C1E|nr:CTP-dependent riboflavin kinase [Halobacterium sp. KA-4]MCD2201683.1 CTP-dependent riboflavin kinase [Halobacterium sp. KA-4]
MTPTTDARIGCSELATLQGVILLGPRARADEAARDLTIRQDDPMDAVQRRLRRLHEDGHLERRRTDDGDRLVVTASGWRALSAEQEEYEAVLSEIDAEFTGTVTSGMGKGQHFVSLSGYAEQFEERLGYKPYPGTLNVDLDEGRGRDDLEQFEGIPIDAWETNGTTYGSATCYRAGIEADGERYEPVHVLVPDRTDHDIDVLELLAPEELRDILNLHDGTTITVYGI